MQRIVAVAALIFLSILPVVAAEPCPITLLSGAGDSEGYSITFRIRGKFPVRQLEFNCKPLRGNTGKFQESHCSERNAYFLPGNEYTVRYTYPGVKPGPLVVSLKDALFANGLTWKPLKRERCRVLRINPKNSKNKPA